MPTMPRGANVYRASQGSQLPVEPETQELGHIEHEADSQDSERPISQWVCCSILNFYTLIHIQFLVTHTSTRGARIDHRTSCR